MAGHLLVTDLPAEKAYRLARRVAADLQYEVQPFDDHAFTAQKGSLAASIFVGAFIAYCNFKIYVDERRADTEIRIERNSPWWTGIIGVNRVKTRVKELANALADRIEDEGSRVLKERDF